MAIAQSSIIALSLMYTELPPSASDLDYWSSPEGQSVSWEQAVQAFATSSAAQTTYPMLASPNTLSQNAAARRDYVIQVFQNLYGIAAADISEEELTYWADTYLTSSPGAIFDFPVVLNQYSPPERQQALANRAEVSQNFAVAMAADGASSFTSAQYSSGWEIVNTVTADPTTVTAADAAIVAFIDGGGGGTGTTFTLLESGAVLTESANSKVSPEGQYLNSSNNTVNGLTFLDGSFVQDPNTTDADVLTAQILGSVTPNIANIETIRFTGSVGAIADIINISGVKLLEVVKNDLFILNAETFPVTLGAGYASNLRLNNNTNAQELTVNLNGTVAGATIVVGNSTKDVNLVVQADSVLKNGDATKETIGSFGGKNNFVVSGDKNLTIDGKITVNNAAADRLDASDFEGVLTLNLGKGSNLQNIVGGKADDTFTLTAADDQINGVALNGAGGTNTLTAKIGNTTTALNKVTNIATVILNEAGADTNITAVDTLVAAGQTLKVDASTFTTKILKFTGTAETNGSFNLIGGDLADTLIGGNKGDILVGNAGTNNLTGNGGADQFVFNQAAAGNTATVADFKVADDDVFALSNAAYLGSPAVGAAMTTNAVAGAVNAATTVLVDTAGNLAGANLGSVRFAYDTTNNWLLFDADGNFAAGNVRLANVTLTGSLTGSNFSIVA